jgi:dolichol-phosphate mannosyltransferase
MDTSNKFKPTVVSQLNKPRLTVVCPVYNEEGVIKLFYDRLSAVIRSLSANYKVDLLFLNNASTDGTYEVISELRQAYPNIYVITLSCNVGYQRSLECGLRSAKGDIVVFIDVDCEDPPEMILRFIAHYEQGYDIVYGERVDRDEIMVIKILRKIFYHIVRKVADENIILYMAEFSLITSEVRDAIARDSNSFPFIRSSIARVGFNRIGLPYRRHRRIAGETHYNLLGMTIFAIAGILSASTLPLRAPIYILPIWLVFTAILGCAQIITGNPWYLLANTLGFALYFGGSIAFIALYVARTYKNGLGRPNYIIHRRYSHFQIDVDE